MQLDILFWGALVRMAQSALAACPTLLVGWLIAAIFERILGRAGTFRLFGSNTWRQLPLAWLLGMLLPVCSLGVIPIMVQMRKSGIPAGTILAFGLTAPLFNPISVLYGLTLSDPIAIMVFCLCSLSIVTIMGLAWDWFFPGSVSRSDPLPPTPYGVRRIAAVGLSMIQQAFSSSTLYILIAILGVGLLSVFLPAGCLQRAAGKDDLIAPLTMASVATFAYVTPMVAIVQVASMFQHGNSIAAAFTLLALGTGINLGMLAWTAVTYRWYRALLWLSCLVLIVLGLSYGVDRPLRPKGVEPADHTHAFDTYCNPFQDGASNLGDNSFRLIQETAHLEEVVAASVVLVLLFAGLLNRLADRRDRWMSFLVHAPPSVNLRRDIVLPNSVIAAVCFLGLIASSVGACFLYYPPLPEIRKEMNAIEAELVGAYNAGDWDKIAYWIPIQEDWAHKMTVSAYLRGRPLQRFQQLKLKVYLTKLELLEHAAEDKDREEAMEWGPQATVGWRRLRESLSLP